MMILLMCVTTVAVKKNHVKRNAALDICKVPFATPASKFSIFCGRIITSVMTSW